MNNPAGKPHFMKHKFAVATILLLVISAVCCLLGSHTSNSRTPAITGSASKMAPPVSDAEKSNPRTSSARRPQDESTAAFGLQDVFAQAKGLSISTPSLKDEIKGLIAGISDADIPVALALVEDVEDQFVKIELYAALLGRMAKKDGAAAMTYIEEKLDLKSSHVQASRIKVLCSWAENDPHGAWSYFQNLGDRPGGREKMRIPIPDGHGGSITHANGVTIREAILGPLFSALATGDQDEAFRRLSELTDAKERRTALTAMAHAAQDEASCRRLLEEIGDIANADERKNTRTDMLAAIARNDPDQAIALARELPTEEHQAPDAAASMMLLMSEPTRRADFIIEMAGTRNLRAAYSNIAHSWGQQDPMAAGEWLNAQPQGPELDEARKAFARIIEERDPPGAMAWAASIGDEKQRAQALLSAHHRWQQDDPAAANAALKDLGFSMQELLAKYKQLGGDDDD